MPIIATLTMNPALDITIQTDALIAGHKLRCPSPRENAGGGGINVALAVRALGGVARAVFPAGGMTGQKLAALLSDAGVAAESIGIAAETRQSFMIDELCSGRQYRLVLPGPLLSGLEIAACLSRIAALEPCPRWLVASGSFPPGVPVAFHHDIARLCRARGIKLIVDTSGAALGRLDDLDAFLVKPSLAELESLTGHPLTDRSARIEAARRLLDRRFARAVLLSLGAGGALLVTRAGCTHFAAPWVEARGTVGAGDAMLTALVCGLAHGMRLREAARWSVAAGAAALHGRDDPARFRGDTGQLVKAVRVTRLAPSRGASPSVLANSLDIAGPAEPTAQGG